MKNNICKIGILTGGGDCPGLNSVIKSIVNEASLMNIDVVGIKHGWRGLISNNDNNFILLKNKNVCHIDAYGGTVLGTSRVNPYSDYKYIKCIQDNLNKHCIDGLIVVGGEDTLNVANRLYKEKVVDVVCVPKTIDFDLNITEYTIGFESAIQSVTNYVDILRTTAQSHSRIFIVEVMGRHAGHLAIQSAISTSAVAVLIPEYDFYIKEVCNIIQQQKDMHMCSCILIVSEGAKPINYKNFVLDTKLDAFGHERLGGISAWLANQISNYTDKEVRSVNLSHLQRGGVPSSYDRRMGMIFGKYALNAIMCRNYGQVVILFQGQIKLVPINDVIKELKIVNIYKSYNTKLYKPII